ncbi:MAG TPA: glycosyltransferase family 4 protein [Gemmatimonadaceae bacterium]|nr:glycosyltransferase family 4 protein [Gemmatimonadaceae bacterium]
MKVLVLATDVFGGTGGIARYTRDFVAAVASYPATIDVVVIPRVIAREPEPLPDRVTYLTAPAGSKSRFVSTVLREAARRPRFDWIVCAHVNLLSIAHAAAALCGAKVFLLTYGIEVWDSRSRLAKLLMERTDAVASISEFTLNKMRQWSPLPADATFLLPNAIDLSSYTPGAPSADIGAKWGLDGRRVLLTLGRMDAREQAKGFDEVLEVLPRLLEEYPQLVYMIVGDGSDRSRLEKKSRDLGIDRSVVFTGYVEESEKLDYYRAADLFLMPSRLEGFGYVFLEALATGLPVIASKLDGSREAVRDGAWGILVDPSNPEELASAIKSALTKPYVPPRTELEYFSRGNFEKRVHAALDSVSGVS